MCVCRIRYPSRNAHAPYCQLRSAPLYHIFPHYLINGTIFGKMLLNIKLFWFFLQFLSEKFLILRRIQPDIIIRVQRSACRAPAHLVRFSWNLSFLERFSKLSRADRQTDMTKLIFALRNFSNAPNKQHRTFQILQHQSFTWNHLYYGS